MHQVQAPVFHLESPHNLSHLHNLISVHLLFSHPAALTLSVVSDSCLSIYAILIMNNCLFLSICFILFLESAPCFCPSTSSQSVCLLLTSSYACLIVFLCWFTTSSSLTLAFFLSRLKTFSSSSSSNLLRSKCMTSCSYQFLPLFPVFSCSFECDILSSGRSAGAFFSYLV